MSSELFRAAHAFIGHRRGGLAISTVLACAGFGAICGSSIATIYRGVMPFLWADVIRLALLVAFPAISLFLPGFMK